MADRSRRSINPRCPRCKVRHALPMHDRDDDGVTSVEPGCTCGGTAACLQCQTRDAEDES